MSGNPEDKGPVEQAADKAKEAAETFAEKAKHIQPGALLSTGMSCCLKVEKLPMLDAAIRHSERSSKRPLLFLLCNRWLTGRQGEKCVIAESMVALSAFRLQPYDVT